ncbi:MAG: extracellular solute-binding protein [Spirochaetaceae bacterium]|nr:MAG: extracellular solute-binding protein [Spirochaetaceae bacterium]
MRVSAIRPALAVAVFLAVAFSAFAAGAVEQTGPQRSTVPAASSADERAEVAAASGTITVYSAGPGGLANAFKNTFEAATGIRVELFQSTTGAVLGRLEAEAANPVADVVILASWPAAFEFKTRGLSLAYPGAVGADELHSAFLDADYHFFGTSASALGVTFNTNAAPAVPMDWSDFTRPEWRGLVNIPDPLLSGSALDFISGYVNVYGEEAWSLFEALAANDVLVAGANNPALTPVVSGAKAAVLAGVDYMGYAQAASGEAVRVVYPSSGTVVNPRPAFILKSSQNIPAAKRFVDFLLSHDAQQLVANAYLLPGRSDFVFTNRDGMDVIPMLEYDWEWMSENAEAITDRFTRIFGR